LIQYAAKLTVRNDIPSSR